MRATTGIFAARWRVFALAMIVLTAAILRVEHLTQPSLWLDEIWSIEFAMGHGSVHDHLRDGVIHYDQPVLTSLKIAAPWWSIWTHIDDATHPPLYYVLLRWWVDFMGTGPAGARSFSVICSLAAVLVLYDVCRLLHGERIALLAAAVMAVAIAQLEFGQQARSYPLLILLGLSCCDALVRIEKFGTSPRRIISLWLFLAAMALTHYYSVGALLALVIYAMVRLRGRARRITLAAFAAAAVIVIAAWGHGFIWQMRSYPDLSPGYLREKLPGHSYNTWIRAAHLPLDYLVSSRIEQIAPLSLYKLAAIVVVVIPLLRLRRRPDLLLWVLWLIGVILPVAAIDLLRHSVFLSYDRFTILASPAAYALIASYEWPRLSALRDGVAYVALLCLLILAGRRMYYGVPAEMDFKGFASIVESNALPDELLVFYNPSQITSPGVWYMGLKYYAPESNHPWVTLYHPADARLLRQLEGRDSLWLIGIRTDLTGPSVLPGWHVQRWWENSAGDFCLMRRGSAISRPTAGVMPSD